ncbi:MAG: lytic transglycosylase domain-containing protein [Acidobacteria bacterium]|nr:lytic transglycosylase domain-containing protein [Acidobacteriota bacterium]
MITAVSACSLWAAPPASRTVDSHPAAASGSVRRSAVRVDPRSGRLVRSVVVESRSLEAQPVEAQEIQPREIRPREVSLTPAAAPAGSPKQNVRELIADAARKHDVDPMLVESMVQVESNYDTRAVSNKGAMGLMQLIPATARRFGVVNPFDAQQNIEGGVRYLKYLQQLYRDDRLALAAYNAGEGAVARYGAIPPYAETQNYVYEVGRRYGQARRAQRSLQATVPDGTVPAAAPARQIETFTDEQGRIHYRMP